MSDDKILYGGGEQVPILDSQGASSLYVAENILLTAEFELASVKPYELAPEQDRAALMLTFKGVNAKTRALGSVTLVMEVPSGIGLIKMMRAKVAEIPVNLR